MSGGNQQNKPPQDIWDKILLKNGKPYWLTWVVFAALIIYLGWLFVHIWPDLGPAYNGLDRSVPGDR